MAISLRCRSGTFFRLHRQNGFTLLEVLVSTLIMSYLLVAALSMLASATRSRLVQASQRLGPSLAKQWMTEILQASYEDIETTLEDGTINGWHREIIVEYVMIEDPDVVAASDRGIKRITVTATAPSGRPTSLVALRSNTSIYDRMPSEERTYVSWVGAQLQIGPNAFGRVTTGVNLLNRIPALDQ